MARTPFTSPVGRIVMGSLYTPNTTDAEGKPLVVKHGANAGQPRSNFFFALAVPKAGESHWSQTQWGQIIYGAGVTAFPQAAQSPSFAWKIEDGDSTVPNKRGRKPVDNEGWAGNWVLKFSGGFAPKVYRHDGTDYVLATEDGLVKPGYFVQVAGNVDGNGSQSQPGIYLNHSMVAFHKAGPEIVFGPNVQEAGFTTPPPAPAFVAPVPPTQAALGVTPNPAFLNVSPAVSAVPPMPVPPVPASPSSPTMTAKAAGASYEAFKAAGWSDVALIADGYMTR